jgi:hypothetical protein
MLRCDDTSKIKNGYILPGKKRAIKVCRNSKANEGGMNG